MSVHRMAQVSERGTGPQWGWDGWILGRARQIWGPVNGIQYEDMVKAEIAVAGIGEMSTLGKPSRIGGLC